MVKFCTSCGYRIEKEGRFCPNCGAPLPEAAPTPRSTVVIREEKPQPISQNAGFFTPGGLETPMPKAAPAPDPEPVSVSVPEPSPVSVPVSAPVPEPKPVFIPMPDPAPAPEPVSVSMPPKQKKSGMWLWITLAAVAVLAVTICVLYFAGVFGGSKDSTDAKDKEEGQSTQQESEKPEKPAEELERTIMVYVVGSDLETRFGAATLDIEEMLEADFDTEKNHVLVYTGGAAEWQNSVVSSDENTILLIEEDDVEVLETMRAQNMGSSSTLSDFLTYAEENYPADQYCLVLWNHGGGPLYGFGDDELSRDYLSLDEIEKALKNSPFGKKNKLEMMGFDACLMGSLETAWVFRDYANYFVASQELEPGYGWDYDFLEELDNCEDGADIGTVIIDAYFDFYEKLFKKSPREETEITLSCVDLSAIDDVEESLDDLFEDVSEEVKAGKIKTVSRCRYRSKAFGKFAGNIEFDLVDLSHLTKLLADEYPDRAEDLQTAMGDYVVYTRSNVKNANGVSIYHPYDDLEVVSYAAAMMEAIDFAPQYTAYIQRFADKFQTADSDNYRGFSKKSGTAQTNGQQSDLSIQLTAEQMETFSGAQYYIFKELPQSVTFSEETEYLHIFSGQDAVLAEDGTLSATYQGKAVFGKNAKTNLYSEIPLAMYQIYDGSKEEKFYFPCMFYYFGDSIEDWELTPVNWLMKMKDGKPVLLNAYDMIADEDNSFPDRFMLDYEDYDMYTFANNSYTLQENADGSASLTFTGSSYGFEYTREEGFSLELCPIDYNDGYYAIFVIEDIYGNSYTSEFIPLGQ